jgi:hypothetical protein
MEDLAETLGASILGFKEFGDRDGRALEVLEAFGYFRARSLPGCSLELPWTSFDAYLSALRAPYRRQLLADLRRQQSHGIRVVHADLDAVHEEIYPLYEAVIDRAVNRLERLNASFFRELAYGFREEGRAILLRRGGALLAAAIVLHGPTRSTFLLTGLDYEANTRFVTYPRLLAEIVRDALERGACHLELGQTSYPLKSRFGGRLDPRWIYLKHRNAFLGRALAASSGVLFPATTEPNRRVFRET